MYACIYIYMYIYIHVHIHIYVYICIYIYIYIYTCIYFFLEMVYYRLHIILHDLPDIQRDI